MRAIDKLYVGTARCYEQVQDKRKMTAKQMKLGLGIWDGLKQLPDDDIAAALLTCMLMFGNRVVKDESSECVTT